MSYQEECEAYAVHGNPERDHWDHEEASQYDRFDGYREEFYDDADNFPCPDCNDWAKATGNPDQLCEECGEAVERMKKLEDERAADAARRAVEENDPNHPNYVPF